MPSESSIYRKIQVIIEDAKSVNPSSMSNFCDKIKTLGHVSFLARRYDSERDEIIQFISVRSIQKTLRLCQILGLIDGEGRLTSQGRQAVQKTRFDKIVAEQIRILLQRNGIRLAEINNNISKKLMATPPILPTCKEIWTEIENEEINYSLFSRLMTLLGHCGGAHSSQSKIYLHIDI
ncbi:MAG: hypothetical protein KKI12_09335 [Proteobacteria bacterium]|nr:hypothetical protein [Pseudomonadota bacterium]